MKDIESRITAARERIHAAEAAAGRTAGSVVMLAVSKGQTLESVGSAYAAGLRAFGENYLREALTRIENLPYAEWHFIGGLQSNKTRTVAERFDWVQSVDRLKLVERLDAQRPAAASPLQVCIQVDVDDEPQKSGCRPEDLLALCDAVAASPRLNLRGIMVIPRPRGKFEAQRAAFATAKSLFDDCIHRGHGLDTLSMGMTDDLEAAIHEGATMVRVGAAVFGPRP